MLINRHDNRPILLLYCRIMTSSLTAPMFHHHKKIFYPPTILALFAKKLFSVTTQAIWAVILSAALLTPSVAAETITLLANGDVSAWEYQTFDDIVPTHYQAAEDKELGQTVLFANSDQGASGYFRKMPINLQATPWLHFQWRIDMAPGGFDERVKAGDDFAWRLYFTAKEGWVYQSMTLVRSQQRHGEWWRSPYNSLINQMWIYTAIGGDAPLGEWQTTSVNLAVLWRDLFDAQAPPLDLVGFMSDGDSAGVQMRSRYGDMVLSASPTPPF